MDSSIAGAVAASATPAPSDPPPMKEGSVAERTRLLGDLFTGYNKNVHPDSLKVEFGVTLIDFNVGEKNDVLETYSWLKYTWSDGRLMWDPSEYGGTTLIRLEPGQVWKPDVTLYNSADPVNMVNWWDSNVLVYSTGKILWVPPCKMQSQCTFNFRKEPYGEQTCMLKMGSWTYDGLTQDFQLYNKTAAIDLSDLHNSSGFEVLSTIAQRNVRYYSCCPEPYVDITFNMTFQRLPGDRWSTGW